MAEKKKKVPEHIQKFFDHSDKADRITDTTELHHREAYNTAVSKHLLDKDGLVDYNLLKDEKLHDTFAEAMSDFYFDKAASYFGYKGEHEPITKKLRSDIFKKDALMRAYVGVTQTELKQYLKQYKENFTFDTFNKLTGEMREAMDKKLKQTAASHFKREHIEDILKYTESDKLFVDKKAVTLPLAIGLLSEYRKKGSVPLKDLDKLFGLQDSADAYNIKEEYRSNYKPKEGK
jgi:hypothetical protein